MPPGKAGADTAVEEATRQLAYKYRTDLGGDTTHSCHSYTTFKTVAAATRVSCHQTVTTTTDWPIRGGRHKAFWAILILKVYNTQRYMYMFICV